MKAVKLQDPRDDRHRAQRPATRRRPRPELKLTQKKLDQAAAAGYIHKEQGRPAQVAVRQEAASACQGSGKAVEVTSARLAARRRRARKPTAFAYGSRLNNTDSCPAPRYSSTATASSSTTRTTSAASIRSAGSPAPPPPCAEGERRRVRRRRRLEPIGRRPRAVQRSRRRRRSTSTSAQYFLAEVRRRSSTASTTARTTRAEGVGSYRVACDVPEAEAGDAAASRGRTRPRLGGVVVGRGPPDATCRRASRPVAERSLCEPAMGSMCNCRRVRMRTRVRGFGGSGRSDFVGRAAGYGEA